MPLFTKKDYQGEAEKIIKDHFIDNVAVKFEIINHDIAEADKHLLVDALSTAANNKITRDKLIKSKELIKLCAYAATAMTADYNTTDFPAGARRTNLIAVANFIKRYPKMHAMEIQIKIHHIYSKIGIKLKEISPQDLATAIFTEKDWKKFRKFESSS